MDLHPGPGDLLGRWRPWGLQGLGARRLGASHAGLGACGLVIGPAGRFGARCFSRRRALVSHFVWVLFEDGIGSLVSKEARRTTVFEEDPSWLQFLLVSLQIGTKAYQPNEKEPRKQLTRTIFLVVPWQFVISLLLLLVFARERTFQVQSCQIIDTCH